MSHVRTPELDAPPQVRYGFPDFETDSSPAAATDYTRSIPGRYRERLISVCCRLVTDATVANREVTLEYRDAEGNRYGVAGAAVTVPASTTQDYCFSSFVDSSEWPVDSTIIVPLTPILLPPTFTWRLHIVNVQAADQLSRVRFARERFFTEHTP